MQRLLTTLFFFILVLQWSLPVFCDTRALVMGSLSQEPKNQVKKLDPLIHYIVENLQDPNITIGKIKVEKSIPKLISASHERKIDLFMGGPFVSSFLQNSGSFQLLLQIPTLDTEKHSALFIVTQKNPIKNLKDLKGNTLAFENPLSPIGYFLPKLMLQERGYKLALKKKESAQANPEEIHYLFSGSDENTLLWLIKGKVEAGTVDSENFKRQPKEILQEFRIIERTIPLPSLFISYRSNLSPDLVEKIKIILKKMHQNERGKKILEELHKIPRFQDISKSTVDFLLKKKEFIQKEVKY